MPPVVAKVTLRYASSLIFLWHLCSSFLLWLEDQGFAPGEKILWVPEPPFYDTAPWLFELLQDVEVLILVTVLQFCRIRPFPLTVITSSSTFVFQ